MKFLLDVNILISGILVTHKDFAKVDAWLQGKEVVICPMAETGFLRITTNSRIPGMGFAMSNARNGLEKFIHDTHASWIADDLRALESRPKTSTQVMDHYLADLAAKHGLKLATLDAGIKHPAVEIVSQPV